MSSFLTKALRGLMADPDAKPFRKYESRGTLSGFTLGVNPLWGQPYPEQVAQDASGMISRQRMREIVLRTPTASACLNAILDFTGGVNIDVRNVDASKPVPNYQQKRIRQILRSPNPDQTKRQFMLSLIRDLVTLGYAAVEIVKTNIPNRPVYLYVMDGARLRVDFDEHGAIRGYDMLNARGVPIVRGGMGNGQGEIYAFPQGMSMGSTEGQTSYQGGETAPDLHGWEPEEVMFFQLNPQSESAYPYSRIVQLFTSAVLEDLMMQFIAERFTDSNIPFGVMDLGNLTETELRLAVDNWNSQSKQPGNRILLTGSKGAGGKWIPFGYHLKDLEATALLAEFRMKIMGIMGVTADVLAESQDASKAGGYNFSFIFKKRGVEPPLNEIAETMTQRLLVDTLHFDDAELYAEEIDARDDFLLSQIDTNWQKLGVLTPNQIRNRRGDISVAGGDESYIYTGNSWIPMRLASEMAEKLIQIAANTTTLSAPGAEGMRVREDVNQNEPVSSGGSGAGIPVNQNGHGRGANSEMLRQVAGKQN